jgi:hypothetical protein
VTDPVVEVEDRVDRIIEEHGVLWGCDDPACAVRTSTLVQSPEKRSWWRRMLGRR